jgi:hypothetical protein
MKKRYGGRGRYVKCTVERKQAHNSSLILAKSQEKSFK